MITDAMIEKAARAALETPYNGEAAKWDEQPLTLQKMWLHDTRAALLAALPDIVDACAKVVWARANPRERWDEAVALNAAAEAIRSLSPTQDK